MILTKTEIYSLRVMSYLASIKENRKVSVKNLSEGTNIPVHYLSKIMRKMVENNLVDAQKGHNGGFSLKKNPKEITFLNILNSVGYKVNSDKCVFGIGKCNSQKPCLLHFNWKKLESNFKEWCIDSNLSEITSLPDSL